MSKRSTKKPSTKKAAADDTEATVDNGNGSNGNGEQADKPGPYNPDAPTHTFADFAVALGLTVPVEPAPVVPEPPAEGEEPEPTEEPVPPTDEDVQKKLIYELEKRASTGHGMDNDRQLMAIAAQVLRMMLGLTPDEPVWPKPEPEEPPAEEPAEAKKSGGWTSSVQNNY